MKNKIIAVIMGVLGTQALYQTISFSSESLREIVAFSNSFMSLWFCALNVLLFHKAYEQIVITRGKKTLIALAYSFALSFALSVGRYLETVENLNIVNPKLWINILVLTAYFTPFVQVAWQWIEEQWKKDVIERVCGKTSFSEFFLYWLTIFLCWLPVFLAFYPGAFVYDAADELYQVETRVFTTHHPLMHVLLLGGLVRAGKVFFDSYNLGIAIYTVFQMLLLSGVFAYTVCYIRRKVKKSGWVWGTLVFYGLFPVIPMYAVCTSKDSIFTAAFLLVVIKMLQFFEGEEKFFDQKGNVVVSAVAAVVMMLFRNNGMYAYVVWAVILAVIHLLLKKKKTAWLKMILLMTVSVICFLLCSKLLAGITKATPGGKQEIMTVPIQQMVRTYVYSPETYTDEEKEILFEIIPEEEMHLYNPKLSDLIKSKFDNEAFGEKPLKYLQLWAKIGIRKPMIYLNAWFMTSYGYWYPDAVINVYGGNSVYTFTYGDSSYFGFETELPGIRDSKFPWLEEQYRKMSLELYQQKCPAVSMLFSPGCLYWVYMFILCFCFQKRKWETSLALGGILLLWLTAVLGPTYLVRYVLILWFALPVILVTTKK